MKLKRILLILGLILTLPINIKAITADFTCDDNKLYVDSTFSCKLFVNPEDSLITSFKTDLSYPKEDFLLESISGYNNWYPLSSTTIVIVVSSILPAALAAAISDSVPINTRESIYALTVDAFALTL